MNTTSAWTPEPGDRYVSVWPHTLGEFEKFPNAVATMSNGALMIWRWDARNGRQITTMPPIKVYAPGAWTTVEHIGNYAAETELEKIRRFTDTYAAGREALAQAGVNPEGYLPEETPAEQTNEIPAYRDPIEQLAPDLLDEENGDVSHRSGVGTLVPRPKLVARPTGAGGGVAAPKEPRGDTSESPDTAVSVAQFVLGDWWGVLRGRVSRAFRGERRRETDETGPLPTHQLGPDLLKSRSYALALVVLSPLGWLILTALR